MIILVLGPNGSGKSLFAEKLAVKLSGTETSHPLLYIATMVPYGEEGLARVEKHKKQRESMGFSTIEKPSSVSAAQFPPDTVTLLEDVSNLLSNALFTGERNNDENSVFHDIRAMCGKCRASVLVSISGLSAGREYDDETNAYIYALNHLNAKLCDLADAVVEMRCGAPVFLKGEIDALD